MPRPEKVQAVADIRERLERAQAVFVAEYAGLSVKEQQELRRGLRAAGGEFRVVKMTLARRAAEEMGRSGLGELLAGPAGLAYAYDDPAAAARLLRDFARDHTRLLVKGALFGSEVLAPERVAALADLEPRPVLLARVAGVLQAPIARMAGLLAALPRGMATALSGLIDKKPAPAAAPAAAPEVASEAAPEAAPAAEASATVTPNNPAARPSRPPRHRPRRPRRTRPTRPRRNDPNMATKTKMTHDDLLELFEQMTVLELSEFVKKFEERFQVTAAAPMAMMAAAPGAAPVVEEEKDEFDLILIAAGEKKIQVIKEVRSLTSLGLKEAKALVDEAPKPVLEGVAKEEAEKAKAILEGVGATVELK